ncbi:MAG: hypothetical protein ACK4TR_08895 [Phenylobacterium sp.]|uniref:phage nozzle protein n=1 Tax=Phenylobacterium sp. TaxID=1871053 RepID=UPI00391BAF56
MSLITQTIPGLHNGVSQQSPLVRATDQCEEMINGWASLAEGMGKRPPTELVAQVLPVSPTNAHIHEINRDASEQYVAIASSGSIRVFDIQTGQEVPCEAPSGWGYLSDVVDWTADVAMYTVADYTFVVNKRRVCALLEAGADLLDQPTDATWLNRTYGFDLLGQEFAPGTLYQYRPNDGGILTGTVQAFNKLPETAAQGAVYRVNGNDETGFVSYYVRYNEGVWDETVVPGLANAIDPATMPHALVRQADGTFRFSPFSWAPRRVGDTDTNPNPGFIGRTISGVFFYQNRLAFLYDENCTLSCVGDFGNFWRSTVLDYIDSDVIDVAATSTRVSLLRHAVPFNDGIVLFSDQTQFAMSNGEIGVTPASVAIRPVTNYEVAHRAPPVALGTEVYFASEKNGWATIREYSRLADSDATSASDITAHVPRYIPAGVHRLIPAPDLNAVFVLTDGAPDKLFVYQFYWIDSSNKAQSAWHEWDLGWDVRVMSGTYLKGYLYLLVARPDGLWLERVNLQAGARPFDAPLVVHLDRLTQITGTFNPGTQRTYFTLPYADTTLAPVRVVRGVGAGPQAMSLIEPTSYQIDGMTLSVPGDESGVHLIGTQYSFRYVFSKQYLRRPDGTPVTTGRLQLRTFTVQYRNTGYFRTEVQPYGAATDPQIEEVLPSKLADFSGKTLGSAELRLGTPQVATGGYSFQVYGEAEAAVIALTNRTHVASTFVSAEWEAFYFNRARA